MISWDFHWRLFWPSLTFGACTTTYSTESLWMKTGSDKNLTYQYAFKSNFPFSHWESNLTCFILGELCGCIAWTCFLLAVKTSLAYRHHAEKSIGCNNFIKYTHTHTHTQSFNLFFYTHLLECGWEIFWKDHCVTHPRKNSSCSLIRLQD